MLRDACKQSRWKRAIERSDDESLPGRDKCNAPLLAEREKAIALVGCSDLIDRDRNRRTKCGDGARSRHSTFSSTSADARRNGRDAVDMAAGETSEALYATE